MDYKGFLSYVRMVDEQDSGKIIEFCKSVERELRIKGINFTFLSDKVDIRWGDRWREFVETTPKNCNLLVPILVESYFESDSCMREYNSFLVAENAFGGIPRQILPILYDECTPPREDSHLIADVIKKDVFQRQYFDWRKIRHESTKSKKRNNAIADIGTRIAQIVRDWEGINSKPRHFTAKSTEPLSRVEDTLSPINTTRVLGWLQDTDLLDEKQIILQLFDQSNTQQRIIKFIYTRIQTNESLIADEVYHRCMLAGVVSGDCTLSEFIFRLRDLSHARLISLHTVGTKTTTIGQLSKVKMAIASSGISNS